LELVNTKAESSDRSLETGMVFTTPKGTLPEPRNMLRDFHQIRKHPKLPQILFHDLRHSAATILKMAGVSDQAIQHLLGHSSVRTTQESYTHLTADGQKQAAAKMDEIFGAVAVKPAVKNARRNRVSSVKEMVGARGFEPPASWTRTRNQRIIYNLAVGTVVIHRCALLPVIKDFADAVARALATVGTTSMQRVGTKLGTA